jgi:hypothetical protein
MEKIVNRVMGVLFVVYVVLSLYACKQDEKQVDTVLPVVLKINSNLEVVQVFWVPQPTCLLHNKSPGGYTPIPCPGDVK